MPDRQIDLTGEPIKFPTVRLANDFIVPWNRNTIIDQILQDTARCPEYYNIKPASRELAEEIAEDVEQKIERMKLESLSGHLIRELVCVSLLERGYEEYSRICSRVGASVMDAREIDVGKGYGSKDNANLQGNPETSHKLKADMMCKEQYLAMMPPHLVEAHRDGRIHIHDLEYFGTRYFCQSWDLRYFLYYGLLPDGRGTKASVSAPAKRAEVAVLHAVKVLGSAQTNFSGGEAFYNFLTFLAPYFEGLPYVDIKQLMQMFVYELTQMTVARGGQSLGYDSLICIKESGKVKIQKIGDVCHKFLNIEGYYDIPNPSYEALSLNRETGDIEWKPITGIYIHKPRSQIVKTILSDGRSVLTTEDHSLFTLDNLSNIIGVSPSQIPDTILTIERIRHDGIDLDKDLMFLLGVCIGDGNLADNNGVVDSSVRLFVANEQVAKRVTAAVGNYNKSKVNWHSDKRVGYFTSFMTEGIPYIKDIGRGACNKKIPYEILNGSDQTLYALLNGLLSTDGDVSRRRYEYSTTSEELAHQIEFILRRLGLDYSITIRDSESNFKRRFPVYVIRISASSSSDIDVTNSSRQFESLDGPNQQKHDFSIIKPLVKQLVGRGVTNYGYAYRSTHRKLKKQDLYRVRDKISDVWDKIKDILPMQVRSIENVGAPEYGYDIGVQDNENFVLQNGIIAHNTVFSSVQLTPGIPNIWKDKPVVIKGHIYDGNHAPLRTYGEFEREVRLAFKAIMEVMLEGDYWGKPFNFPKPEIGIEHEFMVEDEEFQKKHPDIPTRDELYLMSFLLASKFGTPYYDNMLPEYRGSGRGPSCYQCIPGKTKIWFFDGDILSLKSIENIHSERLKSRVSLLLTPTGYKGYSDMLIQPFSGNLIKITMVSGYSIEMTPTHEMPISRDNNLMRCIAKDINIGDKLKIGGYLPSNNIQFMNSMNTLKIESRYSKEFARWLGLYIAEGNILIRPSNVGGTRLQMSFNVTEEDLANEVEMLLKNLFKCKVQRKIIRNNEIRLLVYNKDLCVKILNEQIPSRTGSLGWIPSLILTASNENKIEFLRAFFDGDGSYSLSEEKYPRINFQVASDDIYLGLREMFLSLGFDPHGGKISTRNMYYVSLLNSYDIKKFFNGIDFTHGSDFKTIKKIESVPYSGLVYDPVNIEGHDFIIGNGIVSGNCCAYVFTSDAESDKSLEDKMFFKNGAHFSMGAGQVITLNLPRAAYEAEHDDEIFFATLREYMDLAVEIFKIKREWMQEIVRMDRIPFALQRPRDPDTWKPGSQAVDVDSLTYIVGIVGMNEAMHNHLGKQLYEGKDVLRFALKTVVELNKYAKELSRKHGFTIGVARTPAETTAQRFAVADLLDPRYHDHASKVVRGDIEAFEKNRSKTLDLPVYYTNGTHLPVNAPVGIPDRIMAEHVFFPLLAGGNILHVFMGEKAPDPGGLMDFAMRIAKNTQTGYFAFTRDLTVSMHRYQEYKKD